MKTDRTIIRKALNLVELRLGFALEACAFRRKLNRYNASWRTRSSREKMAFSIARQAHTLEKGMSLRNTRPGFGAAKAAHLREDIDIYIRRFGEDASIENALGILKGYDSFISGSDAGSSGLVESIKAEDVKAMAQGDFHSLLQSRHSVRYFSGSATHEQLEEALRMAALTPSACNRQAWHTRIYEGQKACDLVRWQEGAHGFETEIPTAILVSADLRGFLSYEVHEAWVDGGMYACNLLNALHSSGLGTIPLSCAFGYRKLAKLKDFGLPDNEVPILIIGVGALEEEFKVAKSQRKNIELTNDWM